MLAYHDYQTKPVDFELSSKKAELAAWQTARLKNTHQDLYSNPAYRGGIDFLLQELYGAHDFSARDRDLERIFPKLVKWLPESLLMTASNLVELNLLTQQLDESLAVALHEHFPDEEISERAYTQCYPKAALITLRQRQLELVDRVGDLLDRHAGNPILRFSLNVSERPAKKAGLHALHSFLTRGLEAFGAMDDVQTLMRTLIQREQTILSRIYSNHATPFSLGI